MEMTRPAYIFNVVIRMQMYCHGNPALRQIASNVSIKRKLEQRAYWGQPMDTTTFTYLSNGGQNNFPHPQDRRKWCCLQDPTRSTGKSYSKVVHRDRRWKYRCKAHADWVKEPSRGPDDQMPEETPMEWGVLASDVNNNALPRHCKRQREIPPDSEETIPTQASDSLDVQVETPAPQQHQEGSRHCQRNNNTPQRYKDFVMS